VIAQLGPGYVANVAWGCIAAEGLAFVAAGLALGTSPAPDGLLAGMVDGGVLIAKALWAWVTR
jgi:hypothetical protein